MADAIITTKRSRNLMIWVGIVISAIFLAYFVYSMTGLDGKVNLNSANEEQLMLLPGVNREIARRIIEYRSENRGFKHIEEIRSVAGIGENYEKIKVYLALDDETDLGPVTTKLKDSFVRADYRFVILSMALVIFSFFIRAFRWRYFLMPLKDRIPIRSMFSATMIGFMASDVLPLRVGELVRAWIISQKEDLRMASALGTIVVERVFDMIALLLLLAMVLVCFSADATQLTENASIISAMRSYAPIAGAALFVGVIFLFALCRWPKLANALLGRTLSFLPSSIRERILNIFASFASGLQSIRNPKQAFMAALFSVVLWGFAGTSMYVLLYSFDVQDQVPYLQSFIILVAVAFAVAAPQAPSFIGVFHVVAAKTLEVIFGVEPAVAGCYAIICWATNIFPVVAIGFVCLAKEGISLSDIRRMTEEEQSEQQAAEMTSDGAPAP